MILKKQIVQSKTSPNNPNDLWLKDDKLHVNKNGKWTPLSEEPSLKETTDGLSYIGKDGLQHSLVTEDSLNTMLSITWQDLKDLRDTSKLTPGSLYRITDYNCTTTQENTQSAGHQFDIVLLALSENKLAEEGWAMMHDNIYDVTFSDEVTKKCYVYEVEEGVYNVVDCETLLEISGLMPQREQISIDEETKTATIYEHGGNRSASTDLIEENLTYNYFQNSNLSAWKVWYCLDNDTARFAWADDSVDEGSPASITETTFPDVILYRTPSADTTEGNQTLVAWVEDYQGALRTKYTLTETPNIGDPTYGPHGLEEVDDNVASYTPSHEGTGLPNGRGVIYRLIDEFNNDIKYDFKNIQFMRTITDGQHDADNGTVTWCYTLNAWYNDMCQDASIVGNTMLNDEGYVTGVYDNVFGYATAYDLPIEGVGTFAFALGNNVVLSFDDGGYSGIYSNTIGNEFYFNTIGNYFHSNTIGNGFLRNTIGNSFFCNTIGNSFNNKTISDNTQGKNYGNGGVELAIKS